MCIFIHNYAYFIILKFSSFYVQDTPAGTEINHEVEIDLDEVLDLDGDVERRKFIRSLLKNAKRSKDVIEVCNFQTNISNFNFHIF